MDDAKLGQSTITDFVKFVGDSRLLYINLLNKVLKTGPGLESF